MRASHTLQRTAPLAETRRQALPWAVLALCLAASALVVLRVFSGEGRLLTFGLYLASTAGYLWWLGLRGRPAWPRPGADAAPLLVLVAAQLAMAAYFASYPSHFHYDEFITAYGSWHLRPLPEIDWFAAYPEQVWVAKFPILFFALQKPFLTLLGPSVEAVRLSTWPYLVGCVLYLWALAGAHFEERWLRFAAVALFVFLAPSLYLSSMGVHFLSSTLFLLAAVYHWVRASESGDRGHAVLCGVWAALCFLTYTSSYLVLPLLGALALLRLAVRARPVATDVVARALGAFAAVLLPFGVYAHSHQNYFAQRSQQVGGPWKAVLEAPTPAEALSRAGTALRDGVLPNAVALYQPGVGGVTDYHFGHRALFDPITPGLLVVGALFGLGLAWGQRRELHLLPLAALALGFLVGMALTVPAGAFHRLGVVFPFVGLLLAYALRALPGRALPVAVVGLLVAANLVHAHAMVAAEPLSPSVPIARLLARELEPGAPVTIAADPAFHLERELFFRSGDRYRVRTGWWNDVVDKLAGEAVIVYAPNDEQIAELARRFPGGRVVTEVDGVRLEKHAVFLPPKPPG